MSPPSISPVASRSSLGSLITSAQACALLDVKPATLYTYVSRGLIRCWQPARGRARLYVADDVSRIAVRSAARRGHAPVAAGALRWGEPVLESSITSVAGGVLAYRGTPMASLVSSGATFEDVADLLWQQPGSWPTAVDPTWARLRRVSPGTRPVWRMAAVLPEMALADRARTERAEGDAGGEAACARRIIRTFATLIGRGRVRGGPIAALAADALGLPSSARRTIEIPLVALADHELNASTFSARIAAGAGADLYACLGAALYTLTGPRHGGVCDRIEQFVASLPARGVRAAIDSRLRAGFDLLRGFGHPFYPDGDPRTALVMAAARAIKPSAAGARRLAVLDTVAEAVASRGNESPAVDFALCAIAAALDAPPGTAAALFALGRTAGWVAHILEQRASSALLRPRARYVGPPVKAG